MEKVECFKPMKSFGANLRALLSPSLFARFDYVSGEQHDVIVWDAATEE